VFEGKQEDLEGWLLQMDEFFKIALTRNEEQRMAYIRLCTKSVALEWWKANRQRHNTWEAVKEALQIYYGNHYQADPAYNEIVALKMTGTVQK